MALQPGRCCANIFDGTLFFPGGIQIFPDNLVSFNHVKLMLFSLLFVLKGLNKFYAVLWKIFVICSAIFHKLDNQ